MWKRLKRAVRAEPAGRRAKRYPDDTWLVSYPRSGNTWMRFLIGNLRAPEAPTTFTNVEARVPDIYKNSDRAMQACPRPRVLKSHEPYDPTLGRVIYIVRDPRAVLVSFYHYARRVRTIDDDTPLEAYAERFLAGQVAFGAWDVHVRGWREARMDDPNFLCLRYEALLEDGVAGAEQLATFLNVAVEPAQVACAVARSSGTNMQQLERETGQAWAKRQGARADVPFVRTASADAWRDELPEALACAVHDRWGGLMDELGYA